jgi:hypothetical protein
LDSSSSSSSKADEDSKPSQKKEKPYTEFILSDIVNRGHMGEEIDKILRPKGTGGHDYNICEMMGLGSNDHEDIDWYNGILVSYLPFIHINTAMLTSDQRSVCKYAKKHLDPHLSITKQDNCNLFLVEAKASDIVVLCALTIVH